ncbi:DUF4123 domain-containing protein [Vibrio quintilis]|uniref:DUF4123 domain-containing protein n=1 Tax=Vibrio quintilis TaxID=1117707 RepID=A0A1M7YT58_9VIBR|nr:DUF4123 domain-containing protein [Vibrio quintilis]SHO55716.1 hypothetical protein VQ7734_01462 [Vibrio quintilis]
MDDLHEQLSADLCWYVILNRTSDSQPHQAFYAHGGEDARGLWLGTPYENWDEVMPLMASFDAQHPFLSWVQSQDNEDWGMFAGTDPDVSPEAVYRHFRSLIQVWMPSGNHAFFRFYDPRFSLNVARFCRDDQRAALMGPVQCWLSNSGRVENPEPQADVQEQAFPWWKVPQQVTEILSEDKSMLIINLLQGLKDYSQALYDACPEPVLQQKVRRFVNTYQGEDDHWLAGWIDYMTQEQTRLGHVLWQK